MTTYITCNFSGGSGKRGLTLPVLGPLIWSQTMASPGTTTNSAPAGNQEQGDPMFDIISTSNVILVAIGPAPNAATDPHDVVLEGERLQRFCNPGDKVAWITAF